MDVEERLIGTDLAVAAPGPRARGGASSRITAIEAGSEAGVIGQQLWDAIHARRAAGQTVSAIAREFDLDRKTVRTCLAKAQWSPYRREAPAPTALDAHRAWLAARAPVVNYSARILHRELCVEHGYAGSYESVKRAVRPLRAEATLAALTQQRFETAPGEQAQCDWGQVTVSLGGERVKLHIFVMTLGYSRRAYAEAFLDERMDSLLAAHERAFAHFGGSCEFLLYDRMRTVVSGTIDGRPKFTPRFESFADHWGFTIRVCRPYRAQTKGKVESGVKYVKRNFVPGRTFRDLDDFNGQLAQWQHEVADQRIHGTTHQRPIERFAEESRHLIPSGGHPSFLAAMVRDRIVAEDWLVSIDCNRYSVPYGLIGRTVQVTRVGGQWVIRHRGTIVAEHPVLAGRAQLSVRPEHGPGAAVRNTRLSFSTTPSSERTPSAPDVEIRDLAIYDALAEVA
jgi:transposase